MGIMMGLRFIRLRLRTRVRVRVRVRVRFRYKPTYTLDVVRSQYIEM